MHATNCYICCSTCPLSPNKFNSDSELNTQPGVNGDAAAWVIYRSISLIRSGSRCMSNLWKPELKVLSDIFKAPAPQANGLRATG